MPDASNGLAYEAIPCLVATLLHETESFIGPHKTPIRWRRMQEGDKRGYALVSPPISIEFTKRNANTGAEDDKSGYFSYKIGIDLQTQAGRKAPWLYLSVHCMRYGHLPLVRNQRENDITVLVGANRARLQDWKTDTTLVRLKTTPYPYPKQRDRVLWLEDLPSLLAALKAQPLETPGAIFENPRRFWRGADSPFPLDEYYVLHTEGYRYKGEKSGQSGQSVLTGFGLMERADVLGGLCEGVLRGLIEADTPMQADPRRFDDGDKPLILSDIIELIPNEPLMPKPQTERLGRTEEERHALRDEEERRLRRERQPVVTESLRRSLRGKNWRSPCFHRMADTRDILENALRDSLLLNDREPIPDCLILKQPLVPETAMVQPLEAPEGGKLSNGAVAQWRDPLLQEWQSLLREIFGPLLKDPNVVCAAIVELDKATHMKGRELKITPDRRSVRSVIREACAREGVLSQMIITPPRLTGIPKRDSGTKGKALQTIQEIVTRQIGGVYGTPSEFYRGVGMDNFGTPVAHELDVIALSFRVTQTGARYCLATRLRADGTIDVLLPEENPVWLSYEAAGPRLGQIFARARKGVRDGRLFSPLYARPENEARLNLVQVNGFLEDLLTKGLERPSLILLDAEKWRSQKDSGGDWWQLQNTALPGHLDHLIFGTRSEEQNQRRYGRATLGDNLTLTPNLLAVIRLRSGDETPQYITNRENWEFDDANLMRNYFALTGFIDRTAPDIFHYFSVGKLPQGAGGPQKRVTGKDPFKIVTGRSGGGGIAYRHPPMIEMLPFCVRPDFAGEEGKAALCRVTHYLRSSPAWAMGNLDSPYPMHLGDALINDQLCILGLGDD